MIQNLIIMLKSLTYVISDDSVVQAEPIQYGLYNMPTTLNCSTTLDVNALSIIITWYREDGETKQLLPDSPQLRFDSTDISHEGVYGCAVYISSISLTITKTIDFKVIGELIVLSLFPQSLT